MHLVEEFVVFESGRVGFHSVLEKLSLQGYKNIYFPVIVCDDWIDWGWLSEKCKIITYDLGSDLSPSITAEQVDDWSIFLVINYFGHPVSPDFFRQFRSREIFVIEDACHSSFSRDCLGTQLGMRGDCGIFSFRKCDQRYNFGGLWIGDRFKETVALGEISNCVRFEEIKYSKVAQFKSFLRTHLGWLVNIFAQSKLGFRRLNLLRCLESYSFDTVDSSSIENRVSKVSVSIESNLRARRQKKFYSALDFLNTKGIISKVDIIYDNLETYESPMGLVFKLRSQLSITDVIGLNQFGVVHCWPYKEGLHCSNNYDGEIMILNFY